MPLTQDSPRPYELGTINELPMAANTVIYEGAAVGDNGSGLMRPLVAGDPLRGFAESKQFNNPGTASAVRVRVRVSGLVRVSIGSLVITDVGKSVYASDDDTFTLTVESNSHIGRVHRFVSAGIGIVAFDASHGGFGAIGALTNSTGGTVSGTLAAIASGTPADLAAQGVINGIVRNAIASLADKVNGLVKMAE